MAEQWSLPLLLAVTREVTRRGIKKSGSPVIWPIVGPAMHRLEPAGGWNPNTARKRHNPNAAALEPKQVDNLVEGVRPAQYMSAVDESIQEWAPKAGVVFEVGSVSAPAERIEADEEEEVLVHPVSGKPLDEKGDIVFEDRRQQPTDTDVERLWNAYLEVIKAAKPFKMAQKVAKATIKGGLPTGIAHFGDQHVGSWTLEAQRMLEDYRLLAQTDGLYANFLGDEIDNFIFNFAKWASVMPPGHQRLITEWLMKSLKDKAIAFVLGNHLHWTKKTADIDIMARLAWLEQAFYLGHRGDLHITVGSEVYHFHLAHRAQGTSALNKSNSGRRTADTIGGADVIVEAHLHDPWVHQEYKANKRQVWMRTGTYKRDDDYADELGFPRAQWDMPMVILLPDTHRVIPFLDFRDGLDTLEFLRAKYRKGQIISSAS